ncbi:MAG: hypothetical protein MJE12_04080 [Alphaproteobacteria bacterium]|nr:hypothetical protein [Alphaproteobacteria bacterium]
MPIVPLVILGLLLYIFKRRPLLTESELGTDATDATEAAPETDDAAKNPMAHEAKGNIAPLPDGGAIVYLTKFQRDGYRLTQEQLEEYQSLLAKATSRKYWNRSVILSVLGVGVLIAAANYISPAYSLQIIIGGGAIICVSSILIALYLTKRRFLACFPNTTRARDPNRAKRRLLTSLTNPMFSFAFCNFSLAFCVLLLLLILPYEWDALINGTVGTDDIANRIFVPLVLIVMATFYGNLAIQHIRFRRRHGRAPTKADLDDPEILNAL